LAFSELLFPLLGLVALSGLLPGGDTGNMRELIYQRPGGEGSFREQQLAGLVTYLLSTCTVYALWVRVVLPSLSVIHIFGVLFPSTLLLCGLLLMLGV